MYCRFCGEKIGDGSAFCPMCGKSLADPNENSGGTGPSGNVGDDGGIPGTDKLLSNASIERFAPIAAFAPIAMAVLLTVVGFLAIILTKNPVTGFIVKALLLIMALMFILFPIAATAGLIKVILTGNKPKNVIWVWLAPLATCFASISCLGIKFGWGAVAWIFGILAVLLGLELLARVTISNKPIETPVNVAEDIAIYSRFVKAYREKYPTSKDLERAGYVDPENSYFDGSGFDLLALNILMTIVIIVTCGIAFPWMYCKKVRWVKQHTVINGHRLTFTGTGASLIGQWIVNEILCVITCGIYSFFVYVALKKWELNHTFIDGEPIVPGMQSSYFDGNSFQYFGYGIVTTIALTFTLGLIFPWTACMIEGWEAKHSVINGRRLSFSGAGIALLGEYIIIFVLTLITFGIYSSWGEVRLNKFLVRHTDFVN